MMRRWLIKLISKLIFLPADLLSRLIKVKVKNKEKIPRPGRGYVLATTHPGLFDMHFIERVLQDKEFCFFHGALPFTNFALGRELLHERFEPTGPYLHLSRNRNGKKYISVKVMRQAINHVKQGKPLAIAPQGDKPRAPIVYPGATYIACKTGAPIIPMRIENGFTFIGGFPWNRNRPVPAFLAPYVHTFRYWRLGRQVTLIFREPIYPDQKRYKREGRAYVNELNQHLGRELGLYKQ